MGEIISFKNDEVGSLDDYLATITELIKEKKVVRLLSIICTTDDDDDEPTIYIAGDYNKTREILGDLRLIESAVATEF